ncbi:hypothetical protein DAPPUDRAFT_226059 [Daphnia pulex]|uniref:Uncharacterized protein n=1 Tax=Daphnia pulex TaxID=6669 RepID=E9GVU3_DAPPU|nr:hypothetical protein DAPPUDRAFT_226059 [Daphnia pulex]|eukprot:EFX76237.1 hypothetical protein DAPPUDRAFT_226059 [Daphnia pulex]
MLILLVSLRLSSFTSAGFFSFSSRQPVACGGADTLPDGKNSNNLVGDLLDWRQLHGVGNGGGSPGPPRRLQFPRRPRHHAQGVRLPLVGELATAGTGSAQPDRQAAVDQHAGRSGRQPPPRPPVGQPSQEGDRVALHPAHPQGVLSQRRLPASIQILPLEEEEEENQPTSITGRRMKLGRFRPLYI